MRKHFINCLVDAFLVPVAPPMAPKGLMEFLDGILIPDELEPSVVRPYELDSHPAQREFIREIEKRRYKEYVLMGPVQDGKTLVVLFVMLWTIVELRRPLMYGLPDMQLAGKVWRQKIRPAIESTGFDWILPEKGRGSEGGTVEDILFATGVVMNFLGAGGRNEAAQACVTSWLSLIDEMDAIAARMLPLLLKRNESALDGVTILTSTIKDDFNSNLVNYYEDSTRAVMQHPCPYCGKYHVLEWANVLYDDTDDITARETARLRCPSCEKEYDDDLRIDCAMDAVQVHAGQSVRDDGTVTGPLPRSARYGLRWTALDSPRRNLGLLCVQHRKAQVAIDKEGDHEAMRQFWRDQLVLQYTEDEEILLVREMELAARSKMAALKKGVAPDPGEADILVASVDVQLRRLYVTVMAYSSKDNRWWVVDYWLDSICGAGAEPTKKQTRAALNRVQERINEGYTRVSGEHMAVQRAGVDTAYAENRDEVIKWLHGRIGWHALRGRSAKQMGDTKQGDGGLGVCKERLDGYVAVYRQMKSKPRWNQYVLNVDNLKTLVMRGLRSDVDESGAGQIPHGEAADGEFIRQVTAERREEGTNGPKWNPIRKENHYLDTTGYCIALAKWTILKGPALFIPDVAAEDENNSQDNKADNWVESY